MLKADSGEENFKKIGFSGYSVLGARYWILDPETWLYCLRVLNLFPFAFSLEPLYPVSIVHCLLIIA